MDTGLGLTKKNSVGLESLRTSVQLVRVCRGLIWLRFRPG